MTAVPAEATRHRDVPPSMVERMTLILDVFEGRSSRLTLEDVARATHLPRSTAHRILDQLVRLEWLEHSSFGYSLGGRAVRLASTADDTAELRSAAAPFLHALMLRTGLTVHLAVLDEGRVRYLDKIGARFATSIPSQVGGHAPAHCTALGKAMLARLPAEEIDQQVGRGLCTMTGSSIIDLAGLHQELHRIRGRGGLAVERGECFENIACVAAAICAPEGPIGAISLVGDATTPLERVAPLVLDAARRVSRTLYPDLEPGRTRKRLQPV